MSSSTTKVCNGCGTTIEATGAASAGWLELTIKLVDRHVPTAPGVEVRINDVDVCPACTAPFVGALPKLEPEVSALLLKQERLPTHIASASDVGPHDKILVFLMTEWARKDNRQLIGVDLLYAPGNGFKDEEIRKWIRADAPELFANTANIEKLVTQIVELAEGEVDAKSPGKHRFVVRALQHMHGRTLFSFALPAESSLRLQA